MIPRAFSFAPRQGNGRAGSYKVLESFKRESVSDIERWQASMPWQTLDELKLSFGYSQACPGSDMSQRAVARAHAVQKYCEKLHMTQVGKRVRAPPEERDVFKIV